MSENSKVEPTLLPMDALSMPVSDSWSFARASRWGDQHVLNPVPTKHQLAAETSYFKVTSNPSLEGTFNTTFDSEISQLIVTFISSALNHALFVIANISPIDSLVNKRIFLDYAKLPLESNGSTYSFCNVQFQLDALSKFTQATGWVTGTADPTSIAQIYRTNASGTNGVSVGNPSPSTKNVGKVCFPFGKGATGDAFLVAFGSVDFNGFHPCTAIRATQPSLNVAIAPPIVIGPQQVLFISPYWTPGGTGSTFLGSWELGWWER